MLSVVTGTDDHVRRNRAVWDGWAASFADAGLRNWAADEPTWGIWGIPEAQAGVLPSGLDGLDGIELGCGTGYVMAVRSATPNRRGSAGTSRAPGRRRPRSPRCRRRSGRPA